VRPISFTSSGGSEKSKSSPGDFRHPLHGRIFSNCFTLSAAFGIRSTTPPNPWLGIQGSAGPINLLAAKPIPFLRQKFVSRIRLFSAASIKESLEISHLGQIFAVAGRWSKLRVKIALFGRILGVVGGISVLSLEIRIVSRKFERIAGNPPKSRNFSARAGSFRSSTELLNVQREIRKFG
jgi:hypothetical protein